MNVRLALAVLATATLLAACGVDPNPNNGDPGCYDHSECAHDELCHASECQGALDRRYRVSILDAEVPTRWPNGDEWDAGGGAPDLYVVFGFDPDDMYRTETVQDQFSATWNVYADDIMPSGGTFYLYLRDEDLTVPDTILAWAVEGNDGLIDLARSNGETIVVSDRDTGTVKVRLKVEPQF